jgi:hypothetical protein
LELARLRLRGIYAVVAGVILAFAVPYFQGAFLASQGYADAIGPLAAHQNFEPLVIWVVGHSGADRGARLVEIVPFLLLFVFPPALCRVLWDTPVRTTWIARFAGQVGFGLYVIAGVLGIITSTTAASAYAAAHSAADRAAAVQSFAAAYAIETLLSRVLGGLLIALFLLLVSVRMVRLKAFPAWVGYSGIVVGALQGATALLFGVAPTQPETSTSLVAHFALALWLIAIGLYMFKLVEVEVEGPTQSATTPAS